MTKVRSCSFFHLTFYQEMNEFTLHYRLQDSGRRKSFDFFGKTREELYQVKRTPLIPSPPPRSPSPSPPPSPEPSPEPSPSPSVFTPVSVAPPPTTVEAGTVHVTFRLPNGSRHTGVFPQGGQCSELYRWLEAAGLSEHDVWTAFPRTRVADDDTMLESAVGKGARAVLIVAEREVE